MTETNLNDAKPKVDMVTRVLNIATLLTLCCGIYLNFSIARNVTALTQQVKSVAILPVAVEPAVATVTLTDEDLVRGFFALPVDQLMKTNEQLQRAILAQALIEATRSPADSKLLWPKH